MLTFTTTAPDAADGDDGETISISDIAGRPPPLLIRRRGKGRHKRKAFITLTRDLTFESGFATAVKDLIG